MKGGLTERGQLAQLSEYHCDRKNAGRKFGMVGKKLKQKETYHQCCLHEVCQRGWWWEPLFP